VVINPETGSILSEKMVDIETGYYSNVSWYDAELNNYITVNSEFEALFYDITTGEIKKTYKLDRSITDIKFWRE